jgi:hypothetical protein
MEETYVVRAIDVGYGHVKFSEGPNNGGHMQFDSFPSQAPLSVSTQLATDVMRQRDTFLVPIEDKT